jgi:drug/metabolite transporter (DMT)-like permease
MGAAVLWSSAGAAIKLCALTGWQVSLGRSLVAGVTIFLFVPSARVRPTPQVLLVSLAYAATVSLFAVANKMTTAANSIFLQDTAPLYVVLLSGLVLGERPSVGELLSVPLFLLGLGLFFCDRLTAGQQAGNVVALTAGVAFALCILGLRSLRGANTAPLFWGNLLAALVSVPFAWGCPAPHLVDLGLVAFLGVFQLGLSYVLFARGLRHTSAVEASLLALLEPVLNPLWTFLLVGERPGRWAVVGGSIILCATALRALAPWLAAPALKETA